MTTQTPRCPYSYNDYEDFGELVVCTLPMGHEGMHVLIEQYRVESEAS